MSAGNRLKFSTLRDFLIGFPILVREDWQPAHIDDNGELLDGYLQFCEIDPDDEDAPPPYLLMISAKHHEALMVGEWDGERRHPDSGLPVVELHSIPVYEPRRQ